MRGVVSEYLSPNGLSLASNSSFNGESLPCAMGSGPLSRQGVCRPTAMLCIALSLSSYFVGLFVAQQLCCAAGSCVCKPGALDIRVLEHAAVSFEALLAKRIDCGRVGVTGIDGLA